MTIEWALDAPLLLDRAAERRDTYDHDGADAIVVHAGSVLTVDGKLLRVSPADRPVAALELYLGHDGHRDVIGIVPAEPPTASAGSDGEGRGTMTGLRAFLDLIADRGDSGELDREVGATAVALATWHDNHPRCAVCGDVTEPRKGGWVRWCERDQREHYPRTDPAVIVAITDPDDRLLIAHASYFSPRRFSHLAGYVEPGESLEQALHREVWEECRLSVKDVRYVASQPWPFPASIMVAFTARTDDPAMTLDQDEISEARFVTRQELSDLEADGTIILPPTGSISRRLMEDWRVGVGGS